MKREIRAKIIALSATAIIASFAILITAGCSNKDKSSDNETIPVTTENYDATDMDTTDTSDKSDITEPEEIETSSVIEPETEKNETTSTSEVDVEKIETTSTVEPEIEKVETPSADEPEFEISTVPTPNEPIVVTPTEPVVANPETSIIPSYDADIKEKLGVEVVLTGSNEQQAQQYVEACKAIYPTLPWVNDGVAAGVDVSSLRSETSIDVWSMTEEEVDALINERLAGRNYHDLSLEELYSLQDITGPTAFGCEIYDYFMSLTYKDFNSGGYVIAE